MENLNLSYKIINPQDYGKLLYEMDVKTFNRSYDYPSPSVEMTLNYLKNCVVYLAYRNETIVGLFAYEEKNKKVEVKQIIVLSEFQNKGYGKEIVKEILRINENRDVWLVTHPKNTRALVLYLKSGFEIVGWKDNYYGDNQPRIVLQLRK